MHEPLQQHWCFVGSSAQWLSAATSIRLIATTPKSRWFQCAVVENFEETLSARQQIPRRTQGGTGIISTDGNRSSAGNMPRRWRSRSVTTSRAQTSLVGVRIGTSKPSTGKSYSSTPMGLERIAEVVIVPGAMVCENRRSVPKDFALSLFMTQPKLMLLVETCGTEGQWDGRRHHKCLKH